MWTLLDILCHFVTGGATGSSAPAQAAWILDTGDRFTFLTEQSGLLSPSYVLNIWEFKSSMSIVFLCCVNILLLSSFVFKLVV